MKKFLLIMFLAYDLFAVEPLDVSDIAQSENPTEEQVNDLYSVGNFEVAWRNYQTEKKKDPNSEECKKAKERHDNLPGEIYPYLYYELSVVSREAESEIEEAAIEKLKKAFSLGTGTRVRIIDATSYINGLYISRSEKDRLIKALTSDEELERQVEIFCENHRFVDTSRKLMESLFAKDATLPGGLKIPDNLKDNPKLRDVIKSHMIDESKKSRVYREAMVSYMARSKAFNFLSDYCYAPNKFKSHLIIKGKESLFHVQSGSLFYSDKKFYGRSMVNEEDSAEESMPQVCDLDPSLAFFHEIGHALDFFSHANSYVGVDQTNIVVPKLLGIDTDLDKFNQDRNLKLKILKKDMRTVWYLKNMIEHKEKQLNSIFGFPIFYLKKLFAKEKEINNILDSLEPNLDNSDFINRVFMDDSKEVWQIFGVFYNGDTLYINKMSDFSLYCDLGLPIRSDHVAFKTQKEKTSLDLVIKHGLPRDVYSALMEINGTTMDAYLQKIHGKK